MNQFIQYKQLKQQYLEDYNRLIKIYNLIGLFRLFLSFIFVYSLYKYFETNEMVYVLLCCIIFLFFALLLKVHGQVLWKKNLAKQLISINQDEVSYLKGENIPFDDGTEYIDTTHLYSYDLDLFGVNSLFHNLNRTATYIGREKLANLLLSLLNSEEIKHNQEAIKELSKKIIWRQNLLALARIIKDTKESYQKIIDWSESKQAKTSKISKIIFIIAPILFVSFIIFYFTTNRIIFIKLSSFIFVINLIITMLQLKRVKHEIIKSDKIHETVKRYGLIIEQIEKEEFNSQKLKYYKEKLFNNSLLASKQIKTLSSLFSHLDSIHNVLAAILINGAFLYHTHTLIKILKWKQEYSNHINEWLTIIGEIEALNSLANFSYNNPEFTFPMLNEDNLIICKELGHPLIDSRKRVCNDIEFSNHQFVILTGSNMSGKSTFLRALGINMILFGIGAPICSSKANINPLNIVVSMRQSDSLYNGESYFFAEVKRLKQIMDKIDSEKCFVLLDEILKGTNSEDKRMGTIEIIKKIIDKNTIGCIATHDLEVCKITNDYPDRLINKCFEVEIINDELYFDYKLKNGVCKNKNATFLMKKTGVI